MSARLVHELGAVAVTAPAVTAELNPSSAVGVGELLVIYAFRVDSSTNKVGPVLTFEDSQGNTYEPLLQTVGSAKVHAAIFSVNVEEALATSDTLTLGFGGTPSQTLGFTANSFRGVKASGAYGAADDHGIGGASIATSVSVNRNDLVIAAFIAQQTGMALPAGWNALAGLAGPPQLVAGYRLAPGGASVTFAPSGYGGTENGGPTICAFTAASSGQSMMM